ncbi:MAG: (2Fe-2S)-binding protein [Bacteroidales bacterium]
MPNSPDDIICNCMQISRGEIIESILEMGANSVEQVGELLEAGTVCGSCQDDIKEIISEVAK